jgi:glutathione S-transferase
MPIEAFHWSSGVTLLALIMYFWVTGKTGQARMKHGVKAPATTGAPEFERAFRIQQNTLEQMMLFLPALWLFAALVSDVWAGLAGLLWVIGRILYALGYARAAEKRNAGFGIAILANLLLLVGALVGWFLRG